MVRRVAERVLRADNRLRQDFTAGRPNQRWVMEAFFSTAKSEIGERFASDAEAKAELFDYLGSVL